jgi:Lrp/AsnC family leucine-responsive transcriptional regulator
MKRLRFGNRSLDAIDTRIVHALTEDGRLATAELGRRIGLSAPSVAERIKRLEEIGVIAGYAAQIDLTAIGYDFAVYLRIRPVPGKLATVADALAGIPAIVECDRVTGDDCFIARAYLKSVAELEEVIDRIIPYAMTNTSIIQSSPIPRRLPPLTAIPGTTATS